MGSWAAEQGEGTMCATFSKGFFCDVVCGSLLFVGVCAVGLGGELVRKHLWGGRWRDKGMWASALRDQPQAVCACLPSVCLSGRVGLLWGYVRKKAGR